MEVIRASKHNLLVSSWECDEACLPFLEVCTYGYKRFDHFVRAEYRRRFEIRLWGWGSLGMSSQRAVHPIARVISGYLMTRRFPSKSSQTFSAADSGGINYT